MTPSQFTIYKPITSCLIYIYIGPVPVAIRPYVKLDAKIKSLPIEVYAGVKCRYAEKFAVGYYYDKKRGKNNPIQERKTLKKGCTKELKINEFESKGTQCPAEQLGFDIEVSPLIGVELYYVISAAIKFQFMIPFRINMPEKNLKKCNRKGNFCKTKDKALFASFTVALNLNVYVYAHENTKIFSSVIKRLWKRKKPKQKRISRGNGFRINKSPLTIIPRIAMGCVKLQGVLNPLNKHYRGLCCGEGKGGKKSIKITGGNVSD